MKSFVFLSLYEEIFTLSTINYPLSTWASMIFQVWARKKRQFPHRSISKVRFYTGQHRNRSIRSRISANSFLLTDTWNRRTALSAFPEVVQQAGWADNVSISVSKRHIVLVLAAFVLTLFFPVTARITGSLLSRIASLTSSWICGFPCNLAP